jgi:hypothetical protein
VVTALEYEELAAGRMWKVTVADELEAAEGALRRVQDSCPKAMPKPPGLKPYAWDLGAIGLAASAIESVVGVVYRLSQVLQTQLTATGSAKLDPGSTTAFVVAGMAKGFNLKTQRVFLGLPAVSSGNSITSKLKSVREAALDLTRDLAQQEEKSPCVAPGKAVIESVAARITALNTATPPGSSALVGAIRAAQVEVEAGAMLLALSAEHADGAMVAVKPPLRSQRYIGTATVAVAYRLHDTKGRLVSAGIEEQPKGGGVDRRHFSKYLEPQGIKPPRTSKKPRARSR